jgi:hypothetical protein
VPGLPMSDCGGKACEHWNRALSPIPNAAVNQRSVRERTWICATTENQTVRASAPAVQTSGKGHEHGGQRRRHRQHDGDVARVNVALHQAA